MVKVTLHTKSGSIEKVVLQSEVKDTIQWFKDSGIEGDISVEIL